MLYVFTWGRSLGAFDPSSKQKISGKQRTSVPFFDKSAQIAGWAINPDVGGECAVYMIAETA